MSDVATATAAPRPVRIGGIEYEASPLTYRDIGEYEQAAIFSYLERVEHCIAMLPVQLADSRREKAAEVAMRISVMNRPPADPESEAADHPARQAREWFSQWMRTVEGATVLVHLMLRGRHPDFTKEKAAEFLSDQRVLAEAVEKLNRINSGAPGESPEKVNGNPSKKTPPPPLSEKQ